MRHRVAARTESTDARKPTHRDLHHNVHLQSHRRPHRVQTCAAPTGRYDGPGPIHPCVAAAAAPHPTALSRAAHRLESRPLPISAFDHHIRDPDHRVHTRKADNIAWDSRAPCPLDKRHATTANLWFNPPIRCQERFVFRTTVQQNLSLDIQ